MFAIPMISSLAGASGAMAAASQMKFQGLNKEEEDSNLYFSKTESQMPAMPNIDDLSVFDAKKGWQEQWKDSNPGYKKWREA